MLFSLCICTKTKSPPCRRQSLAQIQSYCAPSSVRKSCVLRARSTPNGAQVLSLVNVGYTRMHCLPTKLSHRNLVAHLGCALPTAVLGAVICPALSLNLRLDDALFQRLVEDRWHSYTDSDDADHGPGGGGDSVDVDGFARVYGSVAAPAITFGRHLRKAAGRGDEELGEEQRRRTENTRFVMMSRATARIPNILQ